MLIVDKNTAADENDHDNVASNPREEPAVSDFEFDQEQIQVIQLFQYIKNDDDVNIHYQLYQKVRDYFGAGGIKRMKYTMPALILNAIELTKQAIINNRKLAKQIFGFIHHTLSLLHVDFGENYAETTLKLYILAAQAANFCSFQAIAYEFIAQAYITYEEAVTVSKAKFRTINYIISGLYSINIFTQESYEILVNKATVFSSRLLRKTDQCRAVSNCAHLFWQNDDAKSETASESLEMKV